MPISAISAGARSRIAWFLVVLPGLLLNYFGQGALILGDPRHAEHPFFHLAPGWALYPLVILAACAATIASQAVISGVFSLTRQAVLLDQFPRVEIQQTSGKEIGQIYVPPLNGLLMIACVGLVIGFGSSSNLAGAYGVAVTTTMVITTLLLAAIARELWKWNGWIVGLITAGLLTVDLAFFGANILKFFDGGWFPLLIGALVFLIMMTWKRGRDLLWKRLRQTQEPLDKFLQGLARKPPQRIPGTAIFLTGRERGTPPVLLHHLKHNQVLKEDVILLNVETQEVPHVPPAERLEVEDLAAVFGVSFSTSVSWMSRMSPTPCARRRSKTDRTGTKSPTTPAARRRSRVTNPACGIGARNCSLSSTETPSIRSLSSIFPRLRWSSWA